MDFMDAEVGGPMGGHPEHEQLSRAGGRGPQLAMRLDRSEGWV